MNKWLIWIVCLLAVVLMNSQVSVGAAEKTDDHGLKASDADIQWWRDAKFGMFIHWGPVTVKGAEIGWSRDGMRGGFEGFLFGRDFMSGPEMPGNIPVEEYDNLYKQFNPTKFNAEEWVQTAKAAGCKYLVFITKHHDGFCMFDSKLTDYKITNSPIQRDLLAELAEACHKNGLKLGLYYSGPDWHHPDYDPSTYPNWHDIDYGSERHQRFLAYFKGQLQELCSNYGKVDIIWFDSGDNVERYDSVNVFKMLRKMQPGVLINNRLGLDGDFDTPECVIGDFKSNRAWETCYTIDSRWGWAWNSVANDNVQSLQNCVQTLVSCAVGDGNLLLNVGPGPTGEMEPQQIKRFKEIGDWLRKYGDSIYGTRGGPFILGPFGGSTYSGNRIYLHVFKWPDAVIKLPPIKRKVTACAFYAGGKAAFKQTGKGIEIQLPNAQRDPIDTVITMDLDGPASTITPVKVVATALSSSLQVSSLGKPVLVSNVRNNDSEYGPEKAADDDYSTCWATDDGITSAWLEMNLGGTTTFDCISLDEAGNNRVRGFELKCRDGLYGEWRILHRGTTVGDNRVVTFPPVSARYVRLEILKSTGGPTISEFRILSSGKPAIPEFHVLPSGESAYRK